MNKYKKGKRVESLSELEVLLGNGRWLYWWEKPVHPSILWNMTLGTIVNGVVVGAIHIAEETI